MITRTVLNFHVFAKNMMIVRTVMVNSTTKYWTNLAARSLFTNEYLDSVNFQIERRTQIAFFGAQLDLQTGPDWISGSKSRSRVVTLVTVVVN